MKPGVRHISFVTVGVIFGILVFLTKVCAMEIPKVLKPPLQTFVGKVIKVTAGDAIIVSHKNRQYRIRLQGIDAPEKRQAFGRKSRQYLSKKILRKEVTIIWQQTDRKCIIGEVYLGERRINLELVQEGFARHCSKFSSDPTLAQAEKEAREANKGLWSMPNARR